MARPGVGNLAGGGRGGAPGPPGAPAVLPGDPRRPRALPPLRVHRGPEPRAAYGDRAPGAVQGKAILTPLVVPARTGIAAADPHHPGPLLPASPLPTGRR